MSVELLQNHSKNSHRATRTALQLNRCDDERRSDLRQRTQVSQILQLIDLRAEHETVYGKILRVTGIDAQRIATEPADLSFQQDFGGFHRESREVHFARRVSIAVALHIGPA